MRTITTETCRIHGITSGFIAPFAVIMGANSPLSLTAEVRANIRELL